MNPDEKNSQIYKSGLNLFSDDELEISSKSQVLEKVKVDRMSSLKPEEDRRRRTIIVEKKNGTYGFTLQSYGIHYRKEQEVEMITYVDHVEYDGPAYKAGMREGDVILSINGYDMEKAEHKTIVNFIKNCDNRMRMVVLFEDCVKKVNLHLRYIQLQDLLKSKIGDFERLCIKEKELLEGKWKTHSLPARKKATNENGDNGANTDNESGSATVFRPAASSEDVKNLLRQSNTYIIQPPTQFTLAYHCFDNNNYRYVIKPSVSSGSGEYLLSRSNSCAQTQTASCNNEHHSLTRGSSFENNATPSSGYKSMSQSPASSYHHQQTQYSPSHSTHHEHEHKSKSRRQLQGHSCTPCMGNLIARRDKTKPVEKDNTSLDAYDLASPCCDPQCVPTRRKSKHHHHKHKHRDKEDKEKGRIPRPKSQSHISPQTHVHHHKDKHDHHHHHRQKLFDLNASLASHCSLHSCTSSNDFHPENSPASYSNSLSTDTLYWEPHSDASTNTTNTTSSHKKPPATPRQPTQQHYYIQKYTHPHAAQIQPIRYEDGAHSSHHVHKPKSWDNLATKGCGGYGFGYGYLDVVGAKGAPQPTATRTQTTITIQHRNSIPRKNGYERYSAFVDVENYAPPPTQFVQETTTTTTTITTKSTENLLGPYNNLSDTNLSCECLDPPASSGMEMIHDKPSYYSSLGSSKKSMSEIARL